MIIEFNKEDNDIFIKHLYEFNKNVQIRDKMAMDAYINQIEFRNNDIIFKITRIETIKIENLEDKQYSESHGEIGDIFYISLNSIEEPYKTVLNSAIREIKINKLISDDGYR
jgi:predicted component of viral defense system (DUF524 family)